MLFAVLIYTSISYTENYRTGGNWKQPILYYKKPISWLCESTQLLPFMTQRWERLLIVAWCGEAFTNYKTSLVPHIGKENLKKTLLVSVVWICHVWYHISYPVLLSSCGLLGDQLLFLMKFNPDLYLSSYIQIWS